MSDFRRVIVHGGAELKVPADHPELTAGLSSIPVRTHSDEAWRVRCATKDRRIAELEAALESVVKIADEAHDHWDNDRDMKVCKILLALAGHRPKYREDIDAIHAIRCKLPVV